MANQIKSYTLNGSSLVTPFAPAAIAQAAISPLAMLGGLAAVAWGAVAAGVSSSGGGDSTPTTVSEGTSTVPTIDVIAPSVPTATVATDGASVTGTAEPGSTVSIKDENGDEIGTTVADADGIYTASLSPALTNGEEVTVTATDAAGNSSLEVTDTAPVLDTTAPAVPTVAAATDDGDGSVTVTPPLMPTLNQ